MPSPHPTEPRFPAQPPRPVARPEGRSRATHWHRVSHDGLIHVLERETPSGWITRSSCLKLRTSGLLVIDPFPQMTEDDHRGLDAIGRPEMVLLTSASSPRSVRAFCHRHPTTSVTGPPGALRVLRRHLAGHVDEVKRLEPLLPEGCTLLTPAGVGRREAWLQARTTFGTAWVVGQAFLDLESVPSDLRGMALGLVGLRSGLTIPPVFRRFHVQDAGAYRAWLFARLRDARPILLVPPRGRVVHDPNLPARLKTLAESLT
jgi:hypothetical protein